MTGGYDGAVLGWATRTAKDNFWRVRDYCELDDLLQDAAICWLRIVRRYPDAGPAHRMSLFQTAYRRHLHDVAERAGKQRAARAGLSEIFDCDAVRGVAEESATLYTKLQQAPEAVRAFVSAVLTDEGCVLWRHPYRVRAGRIRETRSERWARMAKAQVVDLPQQLRDALT